MNKNLLVEGVSPIVYHFCPLPAMYQIAVSNKIILSDLETAGHDSDFRMNTIGSFKWEKDDEGKKTGKLKLIGNKTYRYYLCLSRSPSSLVGYQYMRSVNTGNLWKNALARIEFDGNALNARFKGKAANFFDKPDPGEKVLGVPRSKEENDFANKYKIGRSWELPQIVGNSTKIPIIKMPPSKENQDMGLDVPNLVRTRMSEYEDRVLSDKPTIDHIRRYIKRIDILVTEENLKSEYFRSLVDGIIDAFNNHVEDRDETGRNYFVRELNPREKPNDIVFVYTDRVSFNSMNVRGAINKKDEYRIYFQLNNGQISIPFNGSKRDLCKKLKERFPKLNNDTIRRLVNNRDNYKKIKLISKDINLKRLHHAYNGNTFFKKYGRNIQPYSPFPPLSDAKGFAKMMTAIAFNENYNPQNFVENILYLCKLTGVSNWAEGNKTIDYSNYMLKLCNSVLEDEGNSNTDSWAWMYSNLYMRYQSNREVMNMYNILSEKGEEESFRFAEQYDVKQTKIFTTFKHKYNMAMKNSRLAA